VKNNEGQGHQCELHVSLTKICNSYFYCAFHLHNGGVTVSQYLSNGISLKQNG